MRVRRPAPGSPVRQAVGYVRVEERGDLASRSAAIRAWCVEHELPLATVVHDSASAGEHRPSLAWALEQIDAGRAQLLVVARLRDLARDVIDLSPLLRWFIAPERTLIALDFELDTSTEAGRLAASAVAGVAGWEDERLSTGPATSPPEIPHGRAAVADVPELHDRIAAMRRRGMTLQAIADALNEDGVPTVRGGRLWRPSSVQRATGYRRPSSQGSGIEVRR